MKKNIIISFSVFVAGLCSIIYELLISTAATYFLGDSVKQFSITIGIYLFSMGIGAFLSKYNQSKPISYFISIEYVLGLIGGLSIPIMYYLFVNVTPSEMQFYTWLLIFIIGLMTGMEVPLLTYAIQNVDIKDSLSNILSLDYLGGLIATLIFPFLLLPFIGLFYSSLIFGIINILLGMMMAMTLIDKNKKRYLVFGIFNLGVLLAFVWMAGNLLHAWDEKIYKAPLSIKEQTSHQLIVMTKKQDDIRLFLNRVIQFSSEDEHRYHESLVHTPLVLSDNPKRILILGGGENLASREVLKHPGVETIDIVDLDSMIFHLAKTHQDLVHINQSAATDPRVNLNVGDAFNFLKENNEAYDVIISDLPDPNSEATAKLYTTQFFQLAKRSLTADGIFITQSGEIYMANSAFSCIVNTINEVFPHVTPYHTYVPSFGDWGFIITSKKELDFEKLKIPIDFQTKFLTNRTMQESFVWPKDIPIKATSINTMDNPIILQYFLEDWEKWKVELKGI